MQITKTLQSPGGATTHIAKIGSEKIIRLGYLNVLSPVLLGAIILLLIAMRVNNSAAHRPGQQELAQDLAEALQITISKQ